MLFGISMPVFSLVPYYQKSEGTIQAIMILFHPAAVGHKCQCDGLGRRTERACGRAAATISSGRRTEGRGAAKRKCDSAAEERKC
jgi:hypothetical protein